MKNRKWALLLLAAALILCVAGCGGASPEPTAAPTPEPVAATAEPTPEPTAEPVAEPEDLPSEADPERAAPEETAPQTELFVLNTSSKKYHDPNCASVADISEKNRQDYEGTREELESRGYVACKRCDG